MPKKVAQFKNEYQEALARPTVLSEMLKKGDEAICKKLISEELKKKAEARLHIIKRINGRLNRLRSDREMASYEEKIAKYKKA